MSFTSVHAHLIWSTKGREKLIRESFQNDLYAYVGGILKKRKHVLIAAGGIEDHIHLLVAMHQTQSIADCVRDVKSNSSMWIHKTQPNLSCFAWQTKYGAFSVSKSSIDDVTRYITNQKEHHKHVSYKDEFRTFLNKHGITFDEKYVFE
jgi:REP element-mobilizing transposase RayT